MKSKDEEELLREMPGIKGSSPVSWAISVLCRNGSDVHRTLWKSPPKFYTLASNSDAHTAVVKQNVLMSCMPPRESPNYKLCP